MKYNKFNIGDIVGHKKSPTLKFRVLDVLSGVPEKKGTYGYGYCQIFEGDENYMENIFSGLNNEIYVEDDLFFIRKPKSNELKKMLKEALLEEKKFHSLVINIQNGIEKLKSHKL